MPNLVRVPDNMTTLAILRLLIEGPLRLWQFLMYLEISLPLYTEDLPALYLMGPNHVLFQVRPHCEDLDGEYWGGEVEIENEGRDASVEL